MIDLVRVLLVEDNPGEAELIMEMLSKDGSTLFEVECVVRLSEALKCLKADRFDIVLLDLKLPDSDGLATLRSMRQQASRLPVVVLTGNSDDRVALAAIQEGAQDYLVKGEIDKNLITRSIKYAIERKQAEAMVRTGEAKYRQLYESMMDAYVQVDRYGRIIDCNSVFLDMLGYTNQEIQNLSYIDMTPKRWHDAESQIIEQQVLLRGYSDLFEIEIWRKDETLVPIEVRLVLLKDDAGRPSGMWGVIRDITERKKAEQEKAKLEEQLRQSQKMEAVGQLAGGIAHDFNNILSAITAYAYLIQTRMGSNDPSRDDVDQIVESVHSAAEVTHSLLAFSRKQSMNPKLVSIPDILTRSEKLLSRVIGEDIKISTVLSCEEAKCMADAGHIEQVLMNLATNARDAMPHGGRLTLSTECAEIDESFIRDHGYGRLGRFVCISVSDTGVGMSKETLARIFEPFFTTKEIGKGTGLGLAMVYGIIKQHDGYIDVHAEPGKGTTCHIYLPAIESKEEGIVQAAESLRLDGAETLLYTCA